MILCCGESLIDMLPCTTTDGAEAFAPHVGGAILNTAVALGRLGCDVSLMTGLSSDMFGVQIQDVLDANSVDYTPSPRSDRPTTLAFVKLVDGHATYRFYDENSASRMIVPGDVPGVPSVVRAAFFGGISLCNAPFADTLADLAERYAGTIPVMLDPNIRPGFITDAAAYRARLARIIAVADMIKVSDEDLAWLIPDSDDIETSVGKLMQMGPQLVFVTKGSRGADAYHANGARGSVAATPVEIVDTVGAGDTFNAGVLSKAQGLELLDKDALTRITSDQLTEIMGFAAAAAAITVTRAGANPPWRDELNGV
ncbi:carbohydrate kinase family protein [Arenibacterium sp. CAU 1754]